MTWGRSNGASDLPVIRNHAKRMRREMTEAERRLWWSLRHDLRFEGTHFRRQVPIGPYIVDFVSPTARLVVEADGEQHGRDNDRAYDEARSAFLESQGFRILRFWNGEIFRDRQIVVDTIFAAMQERISPGDVS